MKDKNREAIINRLTSLAAADKSSLKQQMDHHLSKLNFWNFSTTTDCVPGYLPALKVSIAQYQESMASSQIAPQLGLQPPTIREEANIRALKEYWVNPIGKNRTRKLKYN